MSVAVVDATTDEPTDRLSFVLPAHLEAREPPEARGLSRDGVRMLVAERSTGLLTDTVFSSLPSLLVPGDLLVVNTSAVIPAAVSATDTNGSLIVIHLSTQLDDGLWVVEPRRPFAHTTQRWSGEVPRELQLGKRASLRLIHPYLDSERLWVAGPDLPQPVFTWLAANGRPIQYGYVDRPLPISAYQNVYAFEPGSAEMPSAGRPFTTELITRLVAEGVGVAPLVLHTGVASLEADELPYPERVRLPRATAASVNATRTSGGRVIAVGTTVVRALETATGADGRTRAYDGWTDLVITPERGVQAIDGLLTGCHEPQASHLLMLEAVAGRDLLERSYESSLELGYLWHEFGDVHLIVG